MKVQDIKRLIEQAYIEVLREQEEIIPEDPIGDERAGKETVLEDATETMLEKFPTLKAALVKLMTRDYNEFLDTIDWVSPRPTTFRINLANGQDFTLRWEGKNFRANITGKNYYLGKLSEFQQALDKLAILYQEAPLTTAGEEGGAGVDDGFGQADGGGGGDFPGGEEGADAGAEPDFEAPGEGEEAAPADLGDEEIDFEAGEEPAK